MNQDWGVTGYRAQVWEATGLVDPLPTSSGKIQVWWILFPPFSGQLISKAGGVNVDESAPVCFSVEDPQSVHCLSQCTLPQSVYIASVSVHCLRVYIASVSVHCLSQCVFL